MHESQLRAVVDAILPTLQRAAAASAVAALQDRPQRAALTLEDIGEFLSAGCARSARKVTDEPDFPAARQLRPGARPVWIASEVAAWLATRPAYQARPVPPSLERARAARRQRIAGAVS